MMAFGFIALAFATWLGCGWLSWRLYATANLREYAICYCLLPQFGLVLDRARFEQLYRERWIAIAAGVVSLFATVIVYGWQQGISIPKESEVRMLALNYWLDFERERGYSA